MRKQITIEQIVGTFGEQLRASMYFRMPGAVVAYHAGSMTVDVQPMTNDPRTDLDTDGVVTEAWPVVLNVPVAWPRFGGFVLVGPLNKGDPVVLEAFDVDPTTAFAAGAARATAPVDPADVRRHGGAYWKAVPTDLTGAIKSAAAAAAAWILGVDGDPAQILFKAGLIQLGATGGDHVALASKVDGNTKDLKQLLQALSTYLTAIQPIADPSSTATPAMLSAIGAFGSAVVPTGSMLIAAQ